MKDNEILPLTSLRFVAALYVFLFHVHLRWPLVAAAMPGGALLQGAVGMSMFFVLSGFVLGYRYHGADVPYRSYLLNRFARIYPVYAVAALVTVPWLGVSFAVHTLAGLARSLAQLAFLLVANVLLLQAWFPQLFPYWNDGASWSISTEAFFYLLFPFILACLAGRSSRILACVTLAAYCLAVMPAVSHVLFDPKLSHGIFYSMPIFRLPEFVLGIGTYLLAQHLRLQSGWRLETAVLAAGAGLIVYLGVVGDGLPLYVGHNWLALPVIAFAFAVLATSRGPLARLLSLRPLVWAGKISYCFYSFQPLILTPLIRYRAELADMFPWLRNHLLLAGVAFLTLLGVSALAHHWIEEPLRRRLRRFDAPRVLPMPQAA
jgi:peptidoglycan/LPS O-acetylase OafA/YrhL